MSVPEVPVRQPGVSAAFTATDASHASDNANEAAAGKPTLGVALITRDAQQHLAECLRAVQFADDVVVLDSGSTDETCAIARAAGARVVSNTDWQGFGVQKNRAIALLETDWILLIDADEIVSPELAASIQSVISHATAPRTSASSRTAATSGDVASGTAHSVYSLDRLSCFCGRWIQHSGWRPDRVARLFQRGTARFSDDRVHERLLVNGDHDGKRTAEIVTLDGVLRHYSYDDISAVLRKLDAYSAAGAQQRFERGGSASFGKAVGRALWAFLRTYFLKRGFLDGQAGFMIATLNAQTVYYRFLRLIELQDASRKPNRDA